MKNHLEELQVAALQNGTVINGKKIRRRNYFRIKTGL